MSSDGCIISGYENYEVLETKEIPHGTLKIAKSTALCDRAWDDFLNSVSGAEFEQSSMWAAARAGDGWSSCRYIFFLKDEIAGGYQIFTKSKKYIGRFGYVIKGPTYLKENAFLAPVIAEHLLKTAKTTRCNIFILQPPFIAPEVEAIFEKRNLLAEQFLYIKKVSLVVGFDGKSESDFLSGLKGKRQRKLNKAQREGLVFTEGKESELELFYKLMLSTCKRAGVSPNPGSFSYLKQMWDQFASNGLIKLFFVELQQEKVSGVVTILFGKKVYLWKFGWSGKFSDIHPNEYIVWKTIQWGIMNGYDSADFMSISRHYLPSKYKSCTKYPVSEIRGNKEFKLGFGGDLVVFPDSRIVFNNLLLSIVYRLAIYLSKLSPGFFRIIRDKLM